MFALGWVGLSFSCWTGVLGTSGLRGFMRWFLGSRMSINLMRLNLWGWFFCYLFELILISILVLRYLKGLFEFLFRLRTIAI